MSPPDDSHSEAPGQQPHDLDEDTGAPCRGDPRGIERKWQLRWRSEAEPRPSVLDAAPDPEHQPYFCLDMFPYPSVGGFSVNQLRGMIVTDVVARHQEARGRRVLRPLGWDCFGLPIEQEARRRGVSPAKVIDEGIAIMKGQLQRMGMRIDWQCELNTSTPDYYRWTQWIFRELQERGLTYRARASVAVSTNGAPNGEAAIVRASDGSHATKEPASQGMAARQQWMVRITEYADRLHHGLQDLDWPSRVKALQRNWIGRRAGFRLLLKASNDISQTYEELFVFLRRLELVPAGTFLVLAPEHPIIDLVCDSLYEDEVAAYRERTRQLSERERLAAAGMVDGCPTGALAINPVTLRLMPIWISHFVLPSVRFGAILGAPAHDAAHAAFAEAHSLPRQAVLGERRTRRRDRRRKRGPGGERHDEQVMTGIGGLAGVPIPEARRRIRAALSERGVLDEHVTFHLRDWVFARQHYWGEPIPIEYDESGEPQLVAAEALPVEIPVLQELPTSPDEMGPLAHVESFYRIPPHADGTGRNRTRETDIMPQWIASCWYYLRYLDRDQSQQPFDPERVKPWLPVDLCVGGIEHAVLHLLYVRFIAYFLKDLGLTEHEEPFKRVFNQGRFYRKKPSKERTSIPTHRGDRIEAGPYLEEFGGDALRLHLMFLGPPAEDVVWSAEGLKGCRRFLVRARKIVLLRLEKGRFVSRKVLVEKHLLIRTVTQAIETFRLNKAVSAFMEFVNFLCQEDLTLEEVDRSTLRTFAVLVAPFAPHLAAELWERLEGDGRVFEQPWPEFSVELLRPLEVELAIQLEGRIVDRMVVEGHPSDEEIIAQARSREKVREALGGRFPGRWIVIPDRLVNIVLKREPVAGEEVATAGSQPNSEPNPEPNPEPTANRQDQS